MTSLSDFGTMNYQVYAGSISYGTNLLTSDVDKRGLFVAHRNFYLGTPRIYEWEDPLEKDSKFYEFLTFIKLALECNPNIVETICVDEKHVIYADEYAHELRALGVEFLTKNAYARFGSYAYNQLKKMENHTNHNHHGAHLKFIEQYGYDTKNGMHLIRLLKMGIEILKYRQLIVLRPDAPELLEIRHGRYTLTELQEYAKELFRELEEAMRASTIPDVPNFDKINHWAISVIDRVHGKSTRGVFRGVALNILPIEYEMIDKCTLFTVSNRLVRKMNRNEATGIVLPYKDWFTGLYDFSEFKFADTNIMHIHKAINKMKMGDPKMLDIVFAPERYLLHNTENGTRLREFMKTLPSKHALQYKIPKYVMGNLSEMRHWEKLKVNYIPTVEKPYPNVPKGTDMRQASMMTKFGYDTIKAFNLVHVLRLTIELLKTGTIVNSRVYEPELYAIKHGHFKTFEEYEEFTLGLFKEFEEALQDSPLQAKVDNELIETWLVNFIETIHKTM